PAARAFLVLANGLSPICNSITSLPAALSLRATASTSNAVSPVSPWAKVLNVTASFGVGGVMVWGDGVYYRLRRSAPPQAARLDLLLGRDRLRQRPHDGWDD